MDQSGGSSSLPKPLNYPVANTRNSSKEKLDNWFSSLAFNHYLGLDQDEPEPLPTEDDFKEDSDFVDAEYSYGIGIDTETGTQDGERFYSASYLRLREEWRLGTFATAVDKEFVDTTGDSDLVRGLFDVNGSATHKDEMIMAGGQQRICTASLRKTDGERLQLPVGQSTEFNHFDEGYFVKWVLLTPAIWPRIDAGQSKRGTHRFTHPGGWLPNWVDAESGAVLAAETESRRTPAVAVDSITQAKVTSQEKMRPRLMQS